MKRKWVEFLKGQLENKSRVQKQIIDELLSKVEEMPEYLTNEEGQQEGNFEKYQLEVQGMRYIKDQAGLEEEIKMLEQVLEEREFEEDLDEKE